MTQPTLTLDVWRQVTDGRPEYRCHSFIEGGRIRFLSDCSHALAGQTVELPEIDP